MTRLEVKLVIETKPKSQIVVNTSHNNISPLIWPLGSAALLDWKKEGDGSYLSCGPTLTHTMYSTNVNLLTTHYPLDPHLSRSRALAGLTEEHREHLSFGGYTGVGAI